MKALTWLVAGAGTAAALASAAPAAAQSYDYRYDRDRDVVEEVVDGVARVAGAVAAATQGGYYDPRYGNRYGNRYGYGYNNGGERYAADACAYEAQRRYARRYGQVGVDIRSVDWYRSNRLRVYGTLALGGGYGNNGRYGTYDRYGRNYDPYGRNSRYGYSNGNGGQIAFTCTVRQDGRVTDFDTDRYGRYGW